MWAVCRGVGWGLPPPPSPIPPRKAVFYACLECSGSQGYGRNGRRGGLTCSRRTRWSSCPWRLVSFFLDRGCVACGGAAKMRARAWCYLLCYVSTNGRAPCDRRSSLRAWRLGDGVLLAHTWVCWYAWCVRAGPSRIDQSTPYTPNPTLKSRPASQGPSPRGAAPSFRLSWTYM